MEKHVVIVRHKGTAYPFQVTSKLRTRFFNKVKRPEWVGGILDGRWGDGCWLWLGATGRGGYGSLAFTLSTAKHGLRVYLPVRAHVAAYQILVGPIPPGHHVLHTCDNPPCCNPEHLFTGTNTDNVRDAILKGRQPDTRSLNFIDAEDIRSLYKPYDRQFGCHALGRLYGIPYQSVSRIVSGELYRLPWNQTA